MTPASNVQGEVAEAVARAIADKCLASDGYRSRGVVFTKADLAEVEQLVAKYAQAVAKKAVEENTALRAELAEICRLACGDDGMTAKEAVLRQAQTCATVVRDLNREAIAYLQRAESAEATAALLRAKEPESAESVPPERSV